MMYAARREINDESLVVFDVAMKLNLFSFHSKIVDYWNIGTQNKTRKKKKIYTSRNGLNSDPHKFVNAAMFPTIWSSSFNFIVLLSRYCAVPLYTVFVVNNSIVISKCAIMIAYYISVGLRIHKVFAILPSKHFELKLKFDLSTKAILLLFIMAIIPLSWIATPR